VRFAEALGGMWRLERVATFFLGILERRGGVVRGCFCVKR